MKFINIAAFDQPLAKKRKVKQHQSFVLGEKALRPQNFDLNAEDGDGDGRVQDNTQFERPATPKAKIRGGVEGAEKRFKDAYGEDMPDGDGDCYSTALNTAVELAAVNPTAKVRIVHGVPLGTGGEAEGIRFGHAWVEVENDTREQLEQMLENMSDEMRSQMEELIKLRLQMGVDVIDKSNGNDVRMPKGMYYSIGNIDPNFVRSYSVDEALQIATEMGHYGPWD